MAELILMILNQENLLTSKLNNMHKYKVGDRPYVNRLSRSYEFEKGEQIEIMYRLPNICYKVKSLNKDYNACITQEDLCDASINATPENDIFDLSQMD